MRDVISGPRHGTINGPDHNASLSLTCAISEKIYQVPHEAEWFFSRLASQLRSTCNYGVPKLHPTQESGIATSQVRSNHSCNIQSSLYTKDIANNNTIHPAREQLAILLSFTEYFSLIEPCTTSSSEKLPKISNCPITGPGELHTNLATGRLRLHPVTIRYYGWSYNKVDILAYLLEVPPVSPNFTNAISSDT